MENIQLKKDENRPLDFNQWCQEYRVSSLYSEYKPNFTGNELDFSSYNKQTSVLDRVLKFFLNQN